MEKLYKCGLMVGRFQPVHKGHEYMIRKALSYCDKVVIFIGSAQEKRTEKNPFTYMERYTFLESIFNDDMMSGRLYIYPLVDMGYGNVPKWGRYVMDKCFDLFGAYPNLYISGIEEERSKWLDGVEIDRLQLSRGTIKASATEVRETLKKNNYQKFISLVPKQLYNFYNIMKEIINGNLSRD